MDHLKAMTLLEKPWAELKPENIQAAWYKAIIDHEWNINNDNENEDESIPPTFSIDQDPVYTNDENSDQDAEYKALPRRSLTYSQKTILMNWQVRTWFTSNRTRLTSVKKVNRDPSSHIAFGISQLNSEDEEFQEDAELALSTGMIKLKREISEEAEDNSNNS